MSILLDEFLTAPNVVRSVIGANKKVLTDIAKDFKSRGITNILTVARGSSDNAATYFKYIMETIGECAVSKCSPSVTTVYGAKLKLGNNMVLAISQSGMSTDTLLVMENAKASGALTVAVTNNPFSPLARMCDYHINLNAGIEESISATKTFLGQLTAMYMLANALSSASAKLNIAELPPVLEDFIAKESDAIRVFAEETKDINNFIILTRGLCQCVSSELSLKMMEICYKFSRPFSTTEFMHGPISIVEDGTSIMVLAPDSEMTSEFIDMTARLTLLGANVTSFTDIEEIARMSDKTFRMPTVKGMFVPFIYALAVELYVGYTAEALGINADCPRNRKKITITK